MDSSIILRWFQLLLAFGTSFLITYKSVPMLIRIAYHKDLYDKPDGERKVHTRYIPTLGGVAIFISIALGFLFSGYAGIESWTPYLIGSLIGLFFCGLKDDLVGLSPAKKLGTELIMASIVLLGASVSIVDLGGVFGVSSIPIWIGFPLSLFTMIVIVNAYNLIDGIDGLAGGIGAISSFAFGIGFLVANEATLAVLSFMICTVLIAYLIHNFHPASIFMGDTGSLVIGFLLAFLAVNFIPLSDNILFKDVFGDSSPILPVAFLALPLYDTIRSFIRRVRRGKSPFSADSDHIHHTLLRMGWGQKRTVLYLYASALILIITGFVTSSMNPNLSLGIILMTTVVVFPTNGLKRKIAGKLGVDIEAIFRTEKDVQLYEHLEEAKEKAFKRKRALKTGI